MYKKMHVGYAKMQTGAAIYYYLAANKGNGYKSLMSWSLFFIASITVIVLW